MSAVRASIVIALLSCAVHIPREVWAQSAHDALASSTRAPTRHRRHRDRWRNTLSLGATVGVGSPLGLGGAFLEYRPIRWVSASIGGGLGGTFGAAIGATLYIDPIVTRAVAVGVAGSLSHNFAYRSGVVVQGFPPIPDHSDWGSIELETQIRPNRGLMIRFGVGYGFLLNEGDYAIATESELAYVNLPTFPVSNPMDAVRAAAMHQTYGVWFFHIDLAPVWRL